MPEVWYHTSSSIPGIQLRQIPISYFFRTHGIMADRAHTTPQSGMCDTLQMGMITCTMLSSGLDQPLVSFEKVMQFTAEGVITWLQQTSFFIQAGPHAPAIKEAIIMNNLSGNLLVREGYDAKQLAHYLPTRGAAGHLSHLVRCLYTNTGIPLPTGIEPTVETTVQECDHSSAGIPLHATSDPTLVATRKEWDHSSVNADIITEVL
ncbi:hypothetical protein L873DRAFT_1049367 [Choiromyces venosus 120613-1]|uniref:Uncharacterized protein n=1 Tax=Choiromyces venosus 120613-1 TaxID=1336337 RepID=A0A3N4JMS6_9PEZI|nr:hypothetical protein L873DRAFT_1049367 [Choiromyces venosus 120613-1]